MRWNIVLMGIGLAWAIQAAESAEASPSCDPPAKTGPAEARTRFQARQLHARAAHAVLHRSAAGILAGQARLGTDPNRRIVQMLDTSLDLREIEDEWSHFWFTDHPDHLTYDRIEGSLE